MAVVNSAIVLISLTAIIVAGGALAVNFVIPGPEGTPGLEGQRGAVGAAGPVGPQGPQGPVGAVGAAGPVGPQGPQGPVGPVGAGLSPKVQKLRIEMGERKIIQEVEGKEVLAGEFHHWDPAVIMVKKGDTVELTVYNPRRNAHSFNLACYNVDTGRIPGRDEQPDVARRTVTTTFVADKEGVCKFQCNTSPDEAKKDCDIDHGMQVGYLIVLNV